MSQTIALLKKRHPPKIKENVSQPALMMWTYTQGRRSNTSPLSDRFLPCVPIIQYRMMVQAVAGRKYKEFQAKMHKRRRSTIGISTERSGCQWLAPGLGRVRRKWLSFPRPSRRHVCSLVRCVAIVPPTSFSCFSLPCIIVKLHQTRSMLRDTRIYSTFCLRGNTRAEL